MLTSMRDRAELGVAAGFLLACSYSGPMWAAPVVYTDEATYLADLALAGYVSITESFEDRNTWGLLEPFATSTVPDVTSQGVRWTGLGGGANLIHDASQAGNWVLQSSPEGTPSDGFLATAEQPLFGFGGWIRSTNAGTGLKNDVSSFINGSSVAFDIFGVPKANYTFWGVIDSAGISSVKFLTEPVAPPEPGSGDPISRSKTVLLDNMTLGFSAAPSLREPGTGWSSAVGGTYATGANWAGGSTPVTTDNALFHLGSATAYTVTLSQNQTAGQAVVGHDRVALDLGGFQYNLTESNITRESLIVGERPGDVGELTLTHGTLVGVNAVVAHSTASTGHLTIGAGAAVTLSGATRVGFGGTGTLNVHSGGTLLSSGSSFIGQLNGHGTVNVDGIGSQWTAAGSGIILGSGGASGTLNITGGAHVDAGTVTTSLFWGNRLASDTAGSGVINVTGADSTLNANTITLASEHGITPSAMNITGGAKVSSFIGTIGVNGDADVLLDGVGSNWGLGNNGGFRGLLSVGRGSQNGNFITFPAPLLHTGTLTIQNGASVQAKQTFIGETRTGRGVLTVTGQGSSWSSGALLSGNTFIGYEGDGELNVLAGATIQTGQAFVGRFGVLNRLKGVANIDGAGSNWTTPSTIWVGFNNDPQTYSGPTSFTAEGNLNVTGGGTVSALQLNLAARQTSVGIVNITGAGSTITANAVAFGKASTTTTFTFGSNAHMTVASAGLLDVSGDVNIYHGKLTLDQGHVNATNLILHGAFLLPPVSSETGDTRVDLQGVGTLTANVSNLGGFVSPGSPALPAGGVLHILGGYTQGIDGTLAIDLGAALPGQYDRLDVSQAIALAGTLEVSLDAGFAPTAGNVFDILDFASLSGAFDTLNLPTLNAGLAWDTSALLTTGELTVVPEPQGLAYAVSLLLLFVGTQRKRPHVSLAQA